MKDLNKAADLLARATFETIEQHTEIIFDMLIQVQREAYEDACKLVCQYCAKDEHLIRATEGFYLHMGSDPYAHYCQAQAIRQALQGGGK